MDLINRIKNNLNKENAKISTAESCTAGYLSKLLTSIPGSSDYFEGSLIVYSNESKINVLGVDKELIDAHTEVSEKVVIAMAEKVKKIMNTEYSIATTGYADTKGYGTKENPAGTVFIAVSSPDKTTSIRVELEGSRERVTYLASMAALELLQVVIKNQKALSL